MLINNTQPYNISFKNSSKSKKAHRQANIIKSLIPFCFLVSAPTLQTPLANDEFIKTESSIYYNDNYGVIADSLSLNYEDSIVKEALKNKIITIDAGHGETQATTFSNPYGARYYDKKNKQYINEKDITLNISKEVERLLKLAGADVKMTRDSDEYIPIENRSEKVNNFKSNMMVSIHVNANKCKSVHGPEVYVRSKKPNTEQKVISNAVGQIILDNLAKDYKLPSKPLSCNDYNILEETKEIPGILVETGYLSNPKDRQELLNEDYQKLLAKSIAAGIVKYWVETKINNDTANYLSSIKL